MSKNAREDVPLPWNNGEMDRLKLLKYEGLGNDFLVLIDPSRAVDFDANLAKAVCDRHLGVGADGLLRLSLPLHGGDLFMELRNADGSIAETSGNGLRCAVLAGYHEKIIDQLQVDVETTVGTSRVEILAMDRIGGGEIRVEMGQAVITRDETSDTKTRIAYRVDIGNPHLVLLATDDDEMDIRVIGPALESAVPGGQNIELVTLTNDRSLINVDTWERGAGLTLACGTGSCAAAAAAHLSGYVDASVKVHNPGGDVTIELSGAPTAPELILTGAARRIFSIALETDDLDSMNLAIGRDA